MSATVHVLPTPSALDEAWEAYAELARATVDNPKLIYDRDHMQRQALAYKRFYDLFIAVSARS